jgi:AraC-like DNA-binding protein
MTDVRRDPPRGVLRTGPAPQRHVRYLASDELAAFVEHYWVVEWDRPVPGRAAVLSHPSVHLVVGGGRAEVVGVVLGRFERALEASGRVFGVKLRAGAFFAFAHRPVATFTNRSLPIAQVLGDAGARYAAAVAAEPDDERCIAHAERFLRAQRPVADDGMVRARELVEHTAADRSVLRVDQLVDRSGLTKRALQRLFHRYIGASPKWVIQRYRLHEALARVDGGDQIDWTALALELGYYDQAHFINDFKALVGCSPEAYRARS